MITSLKHPLAYNASFFNIPAKEVRKKAVNTILIYCHLKNMRSAKSSLLAYDLPVLYK